MPGQIDLDSRRARLLDILGGAVSSATVNLARQAPRTTPPYDAESRADLDALSEHWRESSMNHLLAESARRKSGASSGDGVRESSEGLAQIKADRDTHNTLRDRLQEDEPEAIVVGEEAEPHDWDAFEAAPPGSVIYSLDSIDGSSPYDSLSFGFSTNLLMYLRQKDGSDRLLMSLTVNSSRLGLVYQFPKMVYVQSPPAVYVSQGDERRLIVEPGVAQDDVRRGFVAAVAAQPHARRAVAEILDTTRSWGLPPFQWSKQLEEDPPLTVFTTGGAPATWGIAMGRLDAFVCASPQTVHDTSGIPALLSLGLRAFGDAGKQLDSDSLMRLFDTLDRPGSLNYKPIPRLVIARHNDLAQSIAECLFTRSLKDPAPELISASEGQFLETAPWIFN